MKNRSPVEKTHVGNGGFTARMVIDVARVGVADENVGVWGRPTKS
jgi:hypothetical protein